MFRPLIRYAVFHGRASRTEYWLFVIFQGLVVGGCFGLAAGALGNDDPVAGAAAFMTLMGVAGLAALALVIPYYAVLVRRLHDIDKSAWWLLLLLPGVLTPFFAGGSLASLAAGGAATDPATAGAAVLQALGHVMLVATIAGICNLILFVMTLLPGTPGPNRFGEDPRNPGGSPDGRTASLYDDERMGELIAEAKRERRGADDYKPVFDFGPGPSKAHSQPTAPQPAAPVEWSRPAWDPGVAPSRPFGKRGG